MSRATLSLEEVLARLEEDGLEWNEAKRSGTARCPAHSDDNPSLSIREGRTAPVVLRCHAGCTFEQIIAALQDGARPTANGSGGTAAKTTATRKPLGTCVAVYPYTDASGGPLYEQLRYERDDHGERKKTFRVRRPGFDPDAPAWGLGQVQPVLYNLEAVAVASPTEQIYLVEGEKCVEALKAHGLTATCNYGGAGKWGPQYTEALTGFEHVAIFPDNDEPGIAHGEKVARALHGRVKNLRVVTLPGLPPGGDVVNWLDAGGTVEQLLGLIAATPLWSPPERPPARHLTDSGNADRLVDRFGGDLRHVREWGWIAYDGTRWIRDAEVRVARHARDTVASIYLEAAAAPDPDRGYNRRELGQHALRSESAARIHSMIALAASDPALEAHPGDFDREPFFLNVLNGTVDLKTSTLQAHRREDLLTKLAPVEHDPEATCPRWLDFLDRIMAGDAETIGFLQRAVGYALTGSTDERCIFLLHGSGANGKTTFLRILQALLGDYATQTDSETFLERRNAGAREDLAALVGARLVVASEIGEGRRVAEVLLKQFTGQDMIRARFLYCKSFTFQPVGKVWWATNHLPTIRGTEDAIWDRVRLVPFSVRLSEGERDPRLAEKLSEELQGILNWALAGCIAWQQGGLAPPDRVRVATKRYREESDPLAGFLEGCCALGDAEKCPSKALRKAYEEWCSAEGEEPISRRSFGDRLKERGCTPGHDENRTWKGIGLQSQAGAAA